jgi:hypothetical protein
MTVERVEFDESEVEPIVGTAPSRYDATVVTFDESEVDPIVARPPGVYDDTVDLTTLESGASIEGGVTPYTFVFDESDVEPIVGRAPTPYTSVVFDETDVEPIIGRRSASPYDNVVGVSPREHPPEPATSSPYRQALATDPSMLEPNPGRRADGYENVVAPWHADFSDEPEVIEGRLPQRAPPTLLQRVPLLHGHISFELSDAWDLPRPTDPPGGLSPAEMQVMSWLRAHQTEIVDVEKRRHIDRRALAAAVAFEALKNVWPASLRAVGPGKVHTKANVVRQAESNGYLPPRTDSDRARLLRTPAGALDYIGAIMQAKADVAKEFGYDIRANVPILTNEYQGRDLTEWRDHLKAKSPGSPLAPANSMGIWAGSHLPYLEAAVGLPDPLAIP